MIADSHQQRERSKRQGMPVLAFILIALVLGRAAATQCADLRPQQTPIAPGQTIREEVDGLLDRGHFQQVSNLLSRQLSRSELSPAERDDLSFEIDRIERIRKDYPYSERALFDELQKAVKNISWDEYQLWIREQRFDSRIIEGERFFMSASVSNLFFRYPGLNDRRVPGKNSRSYDKALYDTCTTIKAAARAAREPYVVPKRFEATMSAKVQQGTAAEGESVRAWLPIPRHYPFQDAFELLSTSPGARDLAPANSSIRSIFLEQPAAKNKPTEFRIQYAYTAHGVFFELDPALVRRCDPEDAALKPFLQEAPHVKFTPTIRQLADGIAGTETNVLLLAKSYYDWIGMNIQYSYAIEYSTIRNISEYCLTKRYGDCGQEALLFITLCRLSGIPARWQSGWTTFPGAKSIHDWTEVYVAPYGWVPVDPYMAIYAMQYANTLPPEKRREVRDFYFGGLDQYRMIANSDHSQPLSPPKTSLRSDTVDFQRGEFEAGGRNIYFDKFTYDLTVREVKLPRDRNIQ